MSKKRNLLVPIAATALAVAALAGCTAEPNASPSASRTASEAADGSNPIPTIPTGKGVISATKMDSCETTGTDVTAKGTVTMPKDTQGDVFISVSWVNSKSSSVYARGVTTVKGEAGEKKQWTTTATLPADVESVSCVLGAVVPE